MVFWNISNATTISLPGIHLSVDTVITTMPMQVSSHTTGIGVTVLGTNAPSGLLSLTMRGWFQISTSTGLVGCVPYWV